MSKETLKVKGNVVEATVDDGNLKTVVRAVRRNGVLYITDIQQSRKVRI